MSKGGVNMARKAQKVNRKQIKNTDEAPIATQLSGRIDYLLKIKRVKDPELMRAALEVMTDLAHAATCLLELTENMPDDGTPTLSFCRTRCEIAIEKINGATE